MRQNSPLILHRIWRLLYSPFQKVCLHLLVQNLQPPPNNLAPVAEFKKWWIVHFAPSSAKSAIPILRHHFDFDFDDSSSELEASRLATAKIASIGPVTTSFLQNELMMRVHATASHPTPQDLVAAIVAYDQDGRNLSL